MDGQKKITEIFVNLNERKKRRKKIQTFYYKAHPTFYVHMKWRCQICSNLLRFHKNTETATMLST